MLNRGLHYIGDANANQHDVVTVFCIINYNNIMNEKKEKLENCF